MDEKEFVSSNFIVEGIEEDLGNHRFADRVHTRFPPEPNGYLHIGHSKAICINFLTAQKFGGSTNLRFDDTNPSKEDTEYVDAIQEDIKWLGFEWDGLYYASDYFEQVYQLAIKLIKLGKAYICELSSEQMREYRGTLTAPGKNSPFRERSIEENLLLFEKMKKGELEEGAMVLRAKIDMSSGNINMRDPIIYRIMKATHHRTGDEWCIYPMYDFAHPLSDSIENITHSLCSLEFEDHRPLYDWFINSLEMECKSRQMEFARLNITYTMMSKRRLLQLVQEGHVSGWDDPRMPTLCGLRRRGYTPESIRDFCDRIGVAKTYSVVEVAMLEHCVREDLNSKAARAMAVLKPLKVIIINYPEGKSEFIDVENNPEKPEMGNRKVAFSREVYIEQDDFCEVPPNRKYFRLAPDMEVRLKSAYIVKCTGYKKSEDGTIEEVYCTYDEGSYGGSAPDGRKVKGTLHWVDAATGVDAEIRMYEHLFTDPDPSAVENWQTVLNPNSLISLEGCKLEPSLAEANIGAKYQFMRTGFFCKDLDSTSAKPVYNCTVGLKDTWAKVAKQEGNTNGA
ncbi:MAG: glutamine--tRNA ligase/YqeY domain fusion protein [Bacillota bacterium]